MNYQEAHIFHLMNLYKEQSWCLDKQVVCILTDKDYNILSYGINEIIACDQQCHDKENRRCETVHAEIVALQKTSQIAHYAFVNLFPCAPCQTRLRQEGIQEIIVAGPKHKKQVVDIIRLESDLYKDILLDNGQEKQLSVAQGELAELITAISDFFYRPEKKIPMEELLDEVADVELMLMQIKTICWKNDPSAYNQLRNIRGAKHIALIDRVVKRML